MMELSAHLEGVICWLPQHNKNRHRIPSNTPFRALALFTSNFPNPEVHDVEVIYAPMPVDLCSQDCFRVKLHFPFWRGKEEEIKKHAKNTEIVILDGYKVAAVCRDITTPTSLGRFMDDNWE